MAEARPGATLAERLDRLFRTVRRRGGGEYSNEEVAEALRERGGPTISATYLWQLRKGIRHNPTKKHLEAVAEFFGVPTAYFFDDEAGARIETELELLAALRDSSVRQLALRASGLSAESLSALAKMVDRVRVLEGLPNDPGAQGAG
ncbi:MAG: XRE family transcriptional regulator [Streptosporangiales bacterium]|nr:XRE family transcriptional regulator [Streptosporangiales bacterium]